jgi:3-isopropylmalate dehydratase small subunit
MKPFLPVSSKIVTLPVNDIDTDQIIPARFLKTTDKLGLGKSLFANWRYLEDHLDLLCRHLSQQRAKERASTYHGQSSDSRADAREERR